MQSTKWIVLSLFPRQDCFFSKRGSVSSGLDSETGSCHGEGRVEGGGSSSTPVVARPTSAETAVKKHVNKKLNTFFSSSDSLMILGRTSVDYSGQILVVF